MFRPWHWAHVRSNWRCPASICSRLKRGSAPAVVAASSTGAASAARAPRPPVAFMRLLDRKGPERAAGWHRRHPLVAEERPDAARTGDDADVLRAVALPGHRQA